MARLSKAIQGVALLGAAAVIGAFSLGVGGVAFEALANTVLAVHAMEALALAGLSMEAGAIAGALTANRGQNITVRQAAAFRQIIYGTQRVGGILIYRSTTGSHHDQDNNVIVIAGHEVDSIENLYLDGRQVFWAGGVGNVTRNGVNFGGAAAGGNHTGPSGVQYNFGGLVYCEARFGDQLEGDVISGLTANDPTWAASATGSPWVAGCTYVYLKIEYDENMFPSDPEVRFTVRGKNDLYDPRTMTRGYSDNWALVVNDVLTDTKFGLGLDQATFVNSAQLIAAANVCDEQVALAAGGTEARYSCHYHYDTSLDPGSVLETLMGGAQGRLPFIGSEYFIYPAYYQGPSFTYDMTSVKSKEITWMPQRSLRDRFNRVNGTYVAPNYPYNVAGNLYDSNGFYMGTIENHFPFAFQPTSYPQYAADVLHGYADDQYLIEDGGIFLPKELSLQTVLSVTQAQRLAKIALMRNRQQGTGTWEMGLNAFGMQEQDVLQFTSSAFGWTNKLLEVQGSQFVISDGSDGEVPSVRTSYNFAETSPMVYEWSTTEELTVYDVPALPTQVPFVPAPPTELTLVSGAGTAVLGVDGISRPRIEVEWNAPLDVLVKQIQTQFKLHNSPTWLDAGLVDVANQLTYIEGVVAGQYYDVRIRSLRASGGASTWLDEGDFMCSGGQTNIGSVYLNPNSPYNTDNNATIDSIDEGGSATVRIYGPGGDGSGFSRYTGASVTTLPAAHFTGLAYETLYFMVYYANFAIVGGVLQGEYVPYLTYDQTLSDLYIFIGQVTTCSAGYDGSGGTGGGSSGGGGALPGGGRNPISKGYSTE